MDKFKHESGGKVYSSLWDNVDALLSIPSLLDYFQYISAIFADDSDLCMLPVATAT